MTDIASRIQTCNHNKIKSSAALRICIAILNPEQQHKQLEDVKERKCGLLWLSEIG